jgi:hypothetical protein
VPARIVGLERALPAVPAQLRPTSDIPSRKPLFTCVRFSPTGLAKHRLDRRRNTAHGSYGGVSGPTNCLVAGGRYPDPMAPNNPVVLHKEQLGGPLPTTSLSGQAHGSRCRSFLLGRRVGFRDRICLAEAAIGQKIL